MNQDVDKSSCHLFFSHNFMWVTFVSTTRYAANFLRCVILERESGCVFEPRNDIVYRVKYPRLVKITWVRTVVSFDGDFFGYTHGWYL